MSDTESVRTKLHQKKHRMVSVVRFDSFELMLLAFMTVVLMLIVTWQMGILPGFFNQFGQAAVLGSSTVR